MSDLNQAIVSSLTMRYTKLAGVMRELAAPLNEEQFWAKPFAFGNSFGHLVLHLTGNLNYYIGAQIAGTGYVRDRPKEFADAAPPSKADTLMKFDEAVAMVVETVRAQAAEFPRHSVAHVQCRHQRRRGYRHSQRQRRSLQPFARRVAKERLA